MIQNMQRTAHTRSHTGAGRTAPGNAADSAPGQPARSLPRACRAYLPRASPPHAGPPHPSRHLLAPPPASLASWSSSLENQRDMRDCCVAARLAVRVSEVSAADKSGERAAAHGSLPPEAKRLLMSTAGAVPRVSPAALCPGRNPKSHRSGAGNVFATGALLLPLVPMGFCEPATVELSGRCSVSPSL